MYISGLPKAKKNTKETIETIKRLEKLLKKEEAKMKRPRLWSQNELEELIKSIINN